MRIVIDMQGAQTSFSGNRGVGRYTIELVKAMVQKPRDHEIILVLIFRCEFFIPVFDVVYADSEWVVVFLHLKAPPPDSHAVIAGLERAIFRQVVYLHAAQICSLFRVKTSDAVTNIRVDV